ncbi:MAG: ATP-dependent DNA helicase RecG [Balneolaceae bacterium]
MYQNIDLNLTKLPDMSAGRINALQKSGIETAEDLLMFFPNRYIDRTSVHPIGDLTGNGETVAVTGRISHIREQDRGRKKRLEVIVKDETGSVKGVWFRGAGYFRRLFRQGSLISFYGTVRRFGKDLSMAHPEVDILKSEADAEALQRIVPVYPGNKKFSSARISHKLIHTWVNIILGQIRTAEFLPESVLGKYSYPDRQQSLYMIHNPETMAQAETALSRFKFEELFLFELGMARLRQVHFERHQGLKFSDNSGHASHFLENLIPFNLTDGQKSALGEIRTDLFSGIQMHRLIQGDVGAGKTVIAIAAILLAIDNGYQAVFMAPTEILAEQHYHTLSKYLEKLDLQIRLLTGGQNRKLRADLLASVSGGKCQIAVGTHAIIQENVIFHNLGLAVIDEQHRFGVKQRAEILKKGNHPHLLVMSATPIPRSLALSVYSDLDISIVRGLPAGRKPVRTAVRSDKKREEVYAFLQQNITEGGQAYIVYPLVEESEAMDLQDATMGFEKIRKRFPDAEVGLIHGRLKSEEKEAAMKRFYSGQLQILVSTTVIEVGVDVSNANVMIIEHAERFGLSQLHQLRGRIGRGKRQSYCILMAGGKISRTGRVRLNKMVQTNDGFEIAEADLELRGPGDFLGTKQSGLPEFNYADITEDRQILEQAKKEAWSIMHRDPELGNPGHRKLRSEFEPYFREKSSLFGLG